MTDPLDALRVPDPPARADPAFVADLRERVRTVLEGEAMTSTTDPSVPLAWPETLAEADLPRPSLSPYLAVPNADRAIGWYAAVFDAKLAGEVFEVEEGDRRLITHAGLVIGNSLLMFAEAQVAEEFIAGETGRPVGGSSADSLVVQVADVDVTLARAKELGAEITRPARDEPYGRTGAMVDPFGRRWLVQSGSA
jgi:uncharacterized glyoxalase superfamily protein PhnB